MNSLQHDLRYLVQGMVVTLVVLGTLAIFGGAIYLFLLLLLINRGNLFQSLLIPQLPLWLILGTLIQIPIWIALTRIRFVSRSFGWSIVGAMVLVLLFTIVGSFFVPS